LSLDNKQQDSTRALYIIYTSIKQAKQASKQVEKRARARIAPPSFFFFFFKTNQPAAVAAPGKNVCDDWYYRLAWPRLPAYVQFNPCLRVYMNMKKKRHSQEK